MEKKETVYQRESLVDLMRRRRDPAGDVPFDPDEEEETQETEIDLL